jgi:hypothetical protein
MFDEEHHFWRRQSAARFEQMAARRDDLVPDSQSVLKDKGRFFRRGRSGEGLALLTPEDRARMRRE